jgi:hypothetical protein
VPPQHDYIAKDLSKQDLRGRDFTNQVLFETDLRGARLYGLQISANCATFDGLKLDDENVALLLMMIGQANIDPRWTTGLEALVLDIVGDRRMRAIRTLMKLT